MIELPEIMADGTMSLEKSISSRRSHRSFADRDLALKDAAQLVWAGQGVTGSNGKRSVPSAGALYPLALYLIAGRIRELAEGVYRYVPAVHGLQQVASGDLRQEVANAALHQNFIAEASLVLVVAGVEEITSVKYGERASRYVLMEAGACIQNLYLQAEALGMGTVVVGAFLDRRLQTILNLDRQEVPLAVLPVGFNR